MDIKPQSCPNPVNVNSKGLLPVAILGTEDFDVTAIDVSTVRFGPGVLPVRSGLEDVATPFTPFTGKEDADDCTDEGIDGFLDLTLKFSIPAIVAAAKGTVSDGEVKVAPLRGELFDGTPFRGEDVVVIVKKGKK